MRETLVKAGCVAVGFSWAAWCAQQRLADALPAEWEGRDIAIVGVVAALPQSYEQGVRFELDVERVLTPGARVPGRIVLSGGGGPARAGETAGFAELGAGERWELTVRLKRPRGTANPHGFDYEAWLLERNLRATGYVRPRAGSGRLARMVHRPAYWIERMRQQPGHGYRLHCRRHRQRHRRARGRDQRAIRPSSGRPSPGPASTT
jgi:competence protein ComEC